MFEETWQQRRYFVRGVARIIMWTILAAVALALLNVVGYWSVAWNLIFWGDPFPVGQASSFLGRALHLSVIGAAQVILILACAAGAYCVLAVVWQTVIRIGGYREKA